jgi:hypothetical protein
MLKTAGQPKSPLSRLHHPGCTEWDAQNSQLAYFKNTYCRFEIQILPLFVVYNRCDVIEILMESY